MAFVQNVEDEEKSKEQGQGGGSEIVVSGSESSAVGNGSSAAPQGKGSAAASSSGWSNLQSYIGANKGNDVALANKIGSTVDNQASGIKQSQQQLGNKLTSDVNAATVKDTGVIKGLTSDPTKVDKSAFNAQRNATYQGPSDVSDYQEYAVQQADLGKFKGNLANTGTQAGREALLSETYARPDYGQGMKSLDSFIIGASPDSKKQIESLGQKYSGFENDWSAYNEDLRGRISGAKQTTQNTAQATKEAFDKALAQSQNAINTARTSADTNTSQRQQQFNTLTTNLQNQDPSIRAEALRQAGIDPQVGEWLMSRGVQPKDLLSQAGGATVGNFLSESEAQKYSALMGLDDKQINDDLTSKGVTDRFFNSDSNKVKAAADARNLQNTLNAQLASRQGARDGDVKRISDKISSGAYDQEVANVTGLSQEDFNFARANGINLAGKFKANTIRLNAGDVANNEQRKEWSDLKALLGINDNFNVNDMQDEGSAFDFDTSGARSDIAAQREILRQRAEQAKKPIIVAKPAEVVTGTPAFGGAPVARISDGDVGRTAIDRSATQQQQGEAERRAAAEAALRDYRNRTAAKMARDAAEKKSKKSGR